MSINKEEIKKCFLSCDKFLYGHGPISPKKYFISMAESISENEKADSYGNGEHLQKFERYLADLFGYEECVFLQSGTLAQNTALRIWSEEKNNKLVGFHPTSHLELHEESSYKKLHNLKSVLIGNKDRLIKLADLEKLNPLPSVVLLELPQREIGGQIPEWGELVEQVGFLKSKGIRVHCDGARIWECQPYYKKSLSEIAGLFDSVYVSFYKGIGAVSGAALLGPKNFIELARVWNRRHGGNLTTSFPAYLSAKINLEKRINSFYSYYEKTLEVANIISNFKNLKIIPSKPQVNMFHLYANESTERLEGFALEIAKEYQIWGLTHWQSTSIENQSKIEFYIGDGLQKVPNKTLENVFRKLSKFTLSK